MREREAAWALTREHADGREARFRAHGAVDVTITIHASNLNIHIQGRDSVAVLADLRAACIQARAQPL